MQILLAVKGLPRTVWLLFAGTFINRFGSFVVPFLLLYLIREGYSVAEAGTAVSAYGVGQLVASVLGGHLADRIGRARTIALSMFCSAASLMALAHAKGIVAIIALIFLAGATAELYRPAASALIADLVEPSQRVTAFAVYRLAINAGVMAGPVTAGFLAERSFFLLFLGDALTSLAFGLFVLFAMPHAPPPRPPARGPSEPEAAAWTVLRDRALLRFLLASTLVALVFFQFETTFGLHVQGSGHSSAVYGLLLSLNGTIVVLLEVPVSSFTSRFPPRKVIALGYLLTGIGFSLNGLAHSVPALVSAVFIWTMGEIIASPIASAYVAGLAPEHLRGRYMGIWGLTFSFGLMLGPSLGARLFSWRPGMLWLACGVLGAVAAAVMITGQKPRAAEPAAGAARRDK